jgi:hypothetical protein
VTASNLLIAQGVYYLITGIWPILHIQSFLTVTGPKTDLWLVKTVGLLVAVIGSVLLIASIRDEWRMENVVLAVGSASVLAAVDIVYAARKRISTIYLLEAGVELLLIGAWILTAR